MKQVLELALEAIEYVHDTGDTQTFDMCYAKPAITAIKEALAQPERDYERGFIDGMQKQMQSSVDKAVNRMAQPEQEPVGKFAKFTDGIWREVTDGSAGVSLYTTPLQRTWTGLTDEEILDVNMSTVTKLIDEPIVCDTDHNIIQLGKAIEAKLKDKNNG